MKRDCENCSKAREGYDRQDPLSVPCTDFACHGSTGRGDETPSGWVERLCDNCEYGPATHCQDKECFTSQKLPNWSSNKVSEKPMFPDGKNCFTCGNSDSEGANCKVGQRCIVTRGEVPTDWVAKEVEVERSCKTCGYGPDPGTGLCFYSRRACWNEVRLGTGFPGWVAKESPESHKAVPAPCQTCINHSTNNGGVTCPYVNCGKAVVAGEKATCYVAVNSEGPITAASFAITSEDPWKHRSEGMKCKTCMFVCNMRCRRHAPTMQGYPAVYPDDWCGDHKLDKSFMGGD
jgi:hypothetical protein